MTPETLKLLEALATKLNTTAEQLWVVLIKQAPITASLHLTCSIIVIVLIALGWRWLLQAKANNDFFDDLPMIRGICALLTILPAGAIFAHLPTIFAGFFNPEYWALMQILSYK